MFCYLDAQPHKPVEVFRSLMTSVEKRPVVSLTPLESLACLFSHESQVVLSGGTGLVSEVLSNSL